ncbi:replication initiator [Streptomyces sp. NPDC054786]
MASLVVMYHPVTGPSGITTAQVSAHVPALMRTCWQLGGLPELAPLRLRACTHTLGYRGHILTKSRIYSTTYTALRAERAEHERTAHGFVDDSGTLTDSQWRYVGSGHTSGAAFIAAGIAEDHARNREICHGERGRWVVTDDHV